MALRICKNGHRFEKTSDCPVCPICASSEMKNKFSDEFPNIGAPASRALSNIGIKTLSDLHKYTEKELLSLHGFGPKALRLINEALKAKSLREIRRERK